MRTIYRLTLMLPIGLIVACGVLSDPPPVEFSVRESLLGAGLILQVQNTSNEALEQLELQITSPSGETRRYNAERLEPYGTLEVGWKKLGGWEIPPEAEVSLRCDGFNRPAKTTVPASVTNPD